MTILNVVSRREREGGKSDGDTVRVGEAGWRRERNRWKEAEKEVKVMRRRKTEEG